MKTKLCICPHIIAPIDLELLIDKVWKDEELQDAIVEYGEWNETELNKTFETVKIRVLYEHLKDIVKNKGEDL
jgi:uncharacterized protein YktA (UPF0223 family)